jgi:predicted DNA-binding transcriptional regulator AlpA
MQQGERDDVMRRMYMLSPRDQLEVHRVLGTHLGGKLDGETEFVKQVRERRESLEAMKRVAKHLGLTSGVAPTVTQYREAWADVADEWSSAHVIRAWGRYRLAEQAYRGERIPLTAAQTSLQRYSAGSAHGFEPPLVGVRQWLATNPPTVRASDYNNYVKEHNDQRVYGKAQGPALIQASAVGRSLGLWWQDVLRVARDDAAAEPLQARYEKEQLEADAGTLGIIGTTTIRLILNKSRSGVYCTQQHDNFPKPVIKVSGNYGWMLADIIAYREGQCFPCRERLTMQYLIMGCREIAEQLGLTRGGVRAAVRANSPTIPRPDGRLAGAHYWLKKNVDAWLALPVSRRNNRPRRKLTPVIKPKPLGYSLSEKDRATLSKLADRNRGELHGDDSLGEQARPCLGQQVRIIMSTAAWRENLQPTLDEIQANRPKKGPAPAYETEELEQCLLYQCLAQTNTYAEALAILVSEDGEKDRITLGFNTNCPRGVGRNLRPAKNKKAIGEKDIPSQTSENGVPSQVTVWRHQQRFGSEKHARSYKKLFEQLAGELIEEPATATKRPATRDETP